MMLVHFDIRSGEFLGPATVVHSTVMFLHNTCIAKMYIPCSFSNIMLAKVEDLVRKNQFSNSLSLS